MIYFAATFLVTITSLSSPQTLCRTMVPALTGAVSTTLRISSITGKIISFSIAQTVPACPIPAQKMQRKNHDSCVFLLCIFFTIVLQPFFQCRLLGKNGIHLIVQVLDPDLGFQVHLIIVFLFLFSFITVTPILWMFLRGKLEVIYFSSSLRPSSLHITCYP